MDSFPVHGMDSFSVHGKFSKMEESMEFIVCTSSSPTLFESLSGPNSAFPLLLLVNVAQPVHRHIFENPVQAHEILILW